MPLIADNYDSALAPSAYVSSVDAAQEMPFRHYFESDATHSVLNDVSVADVVYPLRRPCTARFIPSVGEFSVDGFSPTFVGRGATLEEARKAWLLDVHAGFQDLLHKRPFEMTVEDHHRWDVLSSRIDVAVYRNRTPIQVRQFGKITCTRPYPQQIQWENGERESISIEQVASPDFIMFKSGQPIEAIVARDPVDFRLLRIVHVERRSTPSRLSAAEEAELLKSIGSTRSLPAADWE